VGFRTPIGSRRFDAKPVSAQALADAPRVGSVDAMEKAKP
jgi:hypothetical protein